MKWFLDLVVHGNADALGKLIAAIESRLEPNWHRDMETENRAAHIKDPRLYFVRCRTISCDIGFALAQLRSKASRWPAFSRRWPSSGAPVLRLKLVNKQCSLLAFREASVLRIPTVIRQRYSNKLCSYAKWESLRGFHSGVEDRHSQLLAHPGASFPQPTRKFRKPRGDDPRNPVFGRDTELTKDLEHNGPGRNQRHVRSINPPHLALSTGPTAQRPRAFLLLYEDRSRAGNLATKSHRTLSP